MRRALRARDRGCRFPGCQNRRFVEAHHVHHWACGGETKLDNLILLCRRHHTLVHEGRCSIEALGRGGVRFRDRWGSPIPDVARPPPGDADRLLDANRPPIDPHTCAGGDGERMDLDLTVEALVAIARQREPDSTERYSDHEPPAQRGVLLIE
jgi:HNH endonuclease